jgi:hypothetical protein
MIASREGLEEEQAFDHGERANELRRMFDWHRVNARLEPQHFRVRARRKPNLLPERQSGPAC